MKEIVLAGGCFWGVEEYISRINGIIETKVGYANGNTENPSYEEVCSGITGHAEACYVKFNENDINIVELLKKFWDIIDPTVVNRQGPDIGNQYRTGIYYLNKEDLDIIIKSKEEEQEKYDKPIVTEIKPLKCFYEAEEYHQKYLKKNPEGYCHINL
ncbi:peptide-methionine (S)-S-oxide reductase [Clostridium tetanomorphum]|uniref:Peptide methionine sulfoxide reductase MsrA n=1 Tax=Clostridium tetanomorphum TaxID=1553 RepID=A0A923J1R5_CLOTT|nr:peptide-methionine (S)-S-oxide reductase MsrA [Clostridium tetanomorphum]KAJ51070.1 methionine sulfoxide reductase A [Clostridium tetanomorphum DSM 665]MBC2397990.1 peptide-methionine (S)-S-oxide reductase MsrA [Clostridium tetanomorphum]MBP1864504.1 peptide-methionine (S)-S-oxide reductase [Clostridium tetanomorphum]NRS82965.1 peptide-methionine (S)-S-oxide reductase [Clostridium tetanomorphum]NRZ98939.1 peptide-methionine (S)-S-oxide reductase [Clostridium tetanomorphum]